VTTDTKPIGLYPEQATAVALLLDFIQDPMPASRFFNFVGAAGTGKTFCMREVAAAVSKSRVQIAWTAPTNKAAKVLRRIVGEGQTIFSLLGLRIDKTGELKQLIAGKSPEGLKDLDVVFIDEGSMINKNLKLELERAAEYNDFKVVTIGDKFQLPPVGEVESPMWSLGVQASLSEVRRHDNQILALVTRIRQQIGSIAPNIQIKTDADEAGGVHKLTRKAFRESIYNAVLAGEFADGDRSKIIAWRNVRVSEYNDLVRGALWGAIGYETPYMEGERIVAAGPCTRGEDVLMTTDEEAVVESVTPCRHPLEPKYHALELRVMTENSKSVRLLVIHPQSVEEFARDSEKLAHEARGMPRLWKKFWEHKELFHDIKYAYAITAHRSQGSTYENVWVDYSDILLNRARTEAFQCLYVAASRPTTNLYMGGG